MKTLSSDNDPELKAIAIEMEKWLDRPMWLNYVLVSYRKLKEQFSKWVQIDVPALYTLVEGRFIASRFKKANRFYVYAGKLWEWFDDHIWWPTGGKLYGKYKDLKREIRFGWSRARTGLDVSMTWSLDDYLIDHIHKLLIQYKEQAEPSIDLDFHKGFRQYLDEMILAFEDYKNWVEYGEWGYMDSDWTKKAPWYDNRDEINRMTKEKQDKLKKLFGKHFRGLWW